MTDEERVDELLKDLEEALALEPSPSVAARVRTRTAAEPARGWRMVPHLSAAAVIVVVSAVSYGWWSAHTAAPAEVTRHAMGVTAPAPAARPEAPAPSAVSDADGPRSKPLAVSSRAVPGGRRADAADTREPDVIVSPRVRLAVEYLQAAARAGRPPVKAWSLEPLAEPATVTPAVVELLPIEIEAVPFPLAGEESRPGGGASGGGPDPTWPNGPPSRTRRTS